MGRLLAVLAFLVLAHDALAHGTVVTVATPVTPPVAFAWVGILYGLLFVVANTKVLCKWGNVERGTAIRASLALLFLSSFGFFFAGVCLTHATTAPPPGIGMPGKVFWGLADDGTIWGSFVVWNVLGAIAVAIMTSIGYALLPRKRGACVPMALLTNLLVYGAACIPFLLTSAIASGWHGFYVYTRCHFDLEDLGQALYAYSEDHDGRLPEGRSILAVAEQVAPYLDEESARYGSPRTTCQIGLAEDRQPTPHWWNTALGGFALDELRGLSQPLPLVVCPYHAAIPDRQNVLWTTDLTQLEFWYNPEVILGRTSGLETRPLVLSGDWELKYRSLSEGWARRQRELAGNRTPAPLPQRSTGD